MEKILVAIKNKKSFKEIKTLIKKVGKVGCFDINKEITKTINIKTTIANEILNSENCNLEQLEYLVEQGAKSVSILCRAIKNKHWDFVKYLVNEKLIDINGYTEGGYFPLYEAVMFGNIEIIEFLLDNGANINQKTSCCFSLLTLAIHNNNMDILKLLINRGANIEETRTEFFNETPLFFAVSRENLKAVKILIKAGANLNVFNSYGYSLIYEAVERENVEIVKILIKAGVNVNLQNKNNAETAIHNAIYSERVDLVKILVDAGADVNIQNKEGNTPLHYLFEYHLMNNKGLEMFKSLAKHNKLITNIKNNEGYTPKISDILKKIIKILKEVEKYEKHCQ